MDRITCMFMNHSKIKEKSIYLKKLNPFGLGRPYIVYSPMSSRKSNRGYQYAVYSVILGSSSLSRRKFVVMLFSAMIAFNKLLLCC